MIPFKESYYENKIEEYKAKCLNRSNIAKGDFRVQWEMVYDKRVQGYMHAYKGTVLGYPELYENKTKWMGVTAEEIGGCFEASKRANGKVGVVGLGLGYFVQEILCKVKVSEIVVYEKSPEVIEIYKEMFGDNEKLRIVQGDGFLAASEDFDYFFVDIYKNKVILQVAEDYNKLIKLHNIKEYTFFGVEQFILSLDPEELTTEKLPKNWLIMSDNLKGKFEASKYHENFIKIKHDKVKKILDTLE